MSSTKDLIMKYLIGENLQIIVACLMFFVIGMIGAKFYEKMKQEDGITDEEKSSYYNREQFMRLIQYVIGVAPVLILIVSYFYNQAKAMDDNKGHMYVYILYGFLGAIGLGLSSMIMADIAAYKNKKAPTTTTTSKFGAEDTTKPELSKTEIAVNNASIAAIAGIIIFSLHVFFTIVFAITAKNSDVYSYNAFKTIPEIFKSSKSSPAPTNTFGMNDLLSFGKRRRRY
jgi:hypothetical protein